MGIFIRIDIENADLSPALIHQLVDVCPVDIYAIEADKLVVRPDEEDECTLCELCLKIAPVNAIHIHKLYSGEILVSTADNPR